MRTTADTSADPIAAMLAQYDAKPAPRAAPPAPRVRIVDCVAAGETYAEWRASGRTSLKSPASGA